MKSYYYYKIFLFVCHYMLIKILMLFKKNFKFKTYYYHNIFSLFNKIFNRNCNFFIFLDY